MSKVTKKQLQRDIELLESGVGMNWSDMKKIETRLNHAMTGMAQQLEALEEFATYADNMLTELNHALPDPEYDAKCEAAVAGVEASLDRHRERLGLNKPQLKQLDQSIFEGVFDWVKSAAVSPNGAAYLFSVGKDDFYNISDKYGFQITGRDKCKCIGLGYDASNWQNSLIERDIAKELAEIDLSELTGSDLARAMLERGDKIVLCIVKDYEHEDYTYYDAITHCSGNYFESSLSTWSYAIPINNQGEPLTASEVGL